MFRLAAQEVLRWVLDMQKALGSNPSDAEITKFLWSTLKAGKVVPGYGHGVLRIPVIFVSSHALF